MPYHSVKLRLRSIHGEPFKVHRGLVCLDACDICAEVGPVAAIGAALAGDSNLRLPQGFDEHGVGSRIPGIHVLNDTATKRVLWVIKEPHGKPDSFHPPVFRCHDGDMLGLGNETRNYTR